jgi:hypothetical protein
MEECGGVAKSKFKGTLHTKILIKIYLLLLFNNHITGIYGEVDVQRHALVTSNVWRGMASFTLRPLYSEKKPPVLIVYGAGWAPEPLWTLSWRDNSLLLMQTKPRHTDRKLVAILTVLPRILQNISTIL